MALTAAQWRIRVPGKYLDGHGLILHVVTAAKRYAVFRYVFDGRERSMSLGSADVLTLADARELHVAARAMLVKGLDPLSERAKAKAARLATVSFSEAAERYITAHRSGWRGRSEEHWRQTIRDHVLQHFGSKPVDQVGVDDVLAAIQPLWSTRNVTASTVRSRVELILSFSKAKGWRSGENPARWRDHLDHVLPKPRRVHTVEHRAALPWLQAPGLMSALADDASMPAQCLKLLIMTATRVSEAIEATWPEFDLETATWTVPAHRMKARKEHRVPLSGPALAIVRDLHAVRTGTWVFAGRVRARPVSDGAVRKALRRHGYGHVTVHGFRSCFRDWAADNGHPADLAEMALAHTVGSAVERSYRRSDLVGRRRLLMQTWSEFLTPPPAEMIPLRVA